jgi:hypothetical protein
MVRKKIIRDELSAHIKVNGYQKGAFQDEDSLQDWNMHVDKVKIVLRAADRYV